VRRTTQDNQIIVSSETDGSSRLSCETKSKRTPEPYAFVMRRLVENDTAKKKCRKYLVAQDRGYMLLIDPYK
jgi:hypothetical protein